MTEQNQESAKPTSLKELGLLFFKLGLIAFGGPAAHISMMDDEIVTRRQWLTREHFLDLIGATNLIPGPNSTEMTMHIGYERGGWRGLFLAAPRSFSRQPSSLYCWHGSMFDLANCHKCSRSYGESSRPF